MTASRGDITNILLRWSGGDRDAFDDLMPLVYDELRRRAAMQLRHERVNPSLGATSLVHLAYLRIRDFPSIPWKNRAQFFCTATEVMWHILIDIVRRHRAAKRGRGERPTPIGEDVEMGEVNPADRGPSLADIVELDTALQKLAAVDKRQCRVFLLRSVWGFTIQETSDLMKTNDVLSISTATVEREHRMALAFLKRELGES